LPAVSGSAGISDLFRAGCRNASNSLKDHLGKRIGAPTCIRFHCGVRHYGIDLRFQYLPDVIFCSCRVSTYPALTADLAIAFLLADRRVVEWKYAWKIKDWWV